jgi:phosphoserine phosphatase RsbU/P
MSYTTIFHKIPLLSDLPKEEREYLVSVLSVIKLEPGEVLFREGEPGESLFAILEGQVDVLIGIDTPDERLLSRLGPGEFLGEMSLLIPGRTRTASARVSASTRMWKMTRADFDALMIRQPRLAYTMVQTLTKRLDATTMSSFHDLQEKNRQLQKAYDELKAAQAQIVEKERLERELQVAAEIQISILPQDLPQVPGYTFGAAMQPARMVGGDFYDIFIPDPGHVCLMIGDVADKGIPASIFMARTHALIMAESVHGGSPGDVLRRVNDHLVRLGQSDQFVTVLFGVLDVSTGEIAYARAGHELPLLLTPAGEVQTLPQATGQPVGLFDELLLDENSLSLPPGGTLVLFSDGLTDSRSPDGKTFEHAGVHKLLSGLTGQDGQPVCDALVAAVRSFQSDAHQEDDITLVVVHRSAS